MQVSVESLGGLQRRMTVQVPAAEVDKKVEQQLRQVGRRVKLKGFRPGKVPYKVVQQRYGGEVRDDVLREVVRTSYSKAVSQEKLQPAGSPHIVTDDNAQGEDLKYTATFEVYPDIELKKVEGLKVERPVTAIADSDVDRVLENLREQRAHWHTVERAAASGDRVNVDFAGSIGGEPFDGGSGNGVDIVVGSGQMLEDFDKALVGASAGQSLQAKVRFPKDYPAAEVAGKKALFDITVNSVSERHLPEVDDAFCESFGVSEGGVDELRKGIVENMQRELDDRIRSLLREQILDELVVNNPIELPQVLIDAEADQMRGEAARQMGIDDPEQIPPPAPFLDAARKRVARGLLLGQLVEREQFAADKASVDARLEQLTAQFENPAQIAAAYRSDARLMQQIEMSVVEQKAIDWLIEHARVKERKKSFQDVMGTDNA